MLGNFVRNNRKKKFTLLGVQAQKVNLPLTTILVAATIFNTIFLIMYGGWWIFAFPFVLLPQTLIMCAGFYFIVHKSKGWLRNIRLGSSIYAVVFPLIYVPP